MADNPVQTKLNPDDPSGLVGSTLGGRYVIDSVLGVGGMGVVYKAHQASVDRDVAIKVLMPDMAGDESLIKRFELEAKAASRLVHPNTITVYDFGREGELLYIVMELLQGDSLEALIESQGQLDAERAANIAIKVCKSLGEAHSKGIVHRDIKPDNIFLQSIQAERDLVKVLDFGVAKLRDRGAMQDVTLTQAGIIFGTPKYMSPEQAKAKTLDGRTDLYSLGVVLYEMLMGDVPFRAPDPVSILIQHVHDPPPSFAEKRPDLSIPSTLEAIVMKSLSKDREDRYENVEAFADALDGFIRANYGTGQSEALRSGNHSIAPSGTPAPTGPTPNHTPPPGGAFDSGRVPAGHTGPNDLGLGVGDEGTAGWSQSNLNMGGTPGTQIVHVGTSGRSAFMMGMLVVLALLLVAGVGYIIFRMNDGGNAGGADAGAVTALDTDTDEARAVDAAAPDAVVIASDASTEEADAGTPATDVGAQPDGAVALAADTVAAEDAAGFGVGTGTEADTSDDEAVAVADTRVRVVFVQERPSEGMTFDFGDVAAEATDEAGVFLVDPTTPSFEVLADASGHRSRRVDVDVSDAENGTLEVRVSLRRRSSGSNSSRCIDPATGFRIPYCED